MRRALITGITGQDGTWLAEFLAEKGYTVFGLIRGQENPKRASIQTFLPKLEFVEGDLQDLSSLIAAVEYTQPDEVYNLGAISFVALSFKQPELTADVTGLGVLRMLEAVRIVGGRENPIRFYQASSSEMFGKVRQTPQDENTPFHPRSPYGVAKVFGHYTTMNYRESYDLHASSGILFNHESIPAHTPVVWRHNGLIDISAIGELTVGEATDVDRFSSDGAGIEVWDGQGWTRCLARTAYRFDGEMVILHGRGGVVEATHDHVVLLDDADRSLPAGEVSPGDRLALARQPDNSFGTVLTEEEAWFLGVMAAEGYVEPKGGGGRIRCSDDALLAEAAGCWERLSGGTTRKSSTPSGLTGRPVPAIELNGNRPYLRMVRAELYDRSKKKRVPKRILNAAPHRQEAFLRGYNLGDGLRAGHGIDPFKSFRTTSPVLAAGLVWLARTTLGRRVSLYLQPGALGGGSSYLINLNSGLTPGNKGVHLRKPQEEVRKVERKQYKGWMCDLATDSRRFAAGVGLVVVHNSERRGVEFFSRKVTGAAARIKLGLQDKLSVGNIDSSRDYGYAPDYVEAMWLMLQQDEPDDYVVATGQTHSMREVLDVAFNEIGIDDWSPYVEQDQRFFRPAEVDLLIGDATKARAKLLWTPKVGFEEMIARMVRHDMDIAQRSG